MATRLVVVTGNCSKRCSRSSDLAGATPVLSCASLCVDVKTGSPKASDQVQVMLYMYLLPLARPEYQGATIAGQVVYGDHVVDIPTRPEWPVKPSPRPAALTLRPIWVAESPNTGAAGSTTASPSGRIARRAWAASWPM